MFKTQNGLELAVLKNQITMEVKEIGWGLNYLAHSGKLTIKMEGTTTTQYIPSNLNLKEFIKFLELNTQFLPKE